MVIDFWASWCGLCRFFAPTFTETADRLKGRIVFGKINTEANPSASQKFTVKGIPTIIFFNQGKEVGRSSGALPIEQFVTWLNQVNQGLV